MKQLLKDILENDRLAGLEQCSNLTKDLERRILEAIGPSKIDIRSCKGGFVGHYKPDGSYRAACGYAPSSPKGSYIRNRAGWRGDSCVVSPREALSGGAGRLCPKCEVKIRELLEDS